MLAEVCGRLLLSDHPDLSDQLSNIIRQFEDIQPVSVIFSQRFKDALKGNTSLKRSRRWIMQACEYSELTILRFLYRDTGGATITPFLG